MERPRDREKKEASRESKSTIDWGGVAWVDKVVICEQGRADENSLLQNYRLIFIAMATVLLVATFSVGWTHWWGGLLGIITLFLAILWILTCHRRGELVDDWEIMLVELWHEAGLTEIERHYSWAKQRQEAREKMKTGMWNKVSYFLPSLWDFHYARWVLNLVIPLFIIGLSAWAIYHCFFTL